MSNCEILAPVVEKKQPDLDDPNNLTLSTKLSTEQLICKSPQQESATNSIKSHPKRENIPIFVEIDAEAQESRFLLFYGVLHFGFGFLMLAFGCLIIHYEANLSQLGGGVWAGCLAMSTGIVGILASAKECCPSTSQRIFQTVFLALSLSTLAASQLIVALAAIGTVRDVNTSEFDTIDKIEVLKTAVPPGKISILLPVNYMCILTNFTLLVTSLAEFITAAITSYKCSRLLCPCFRKKLKDLYGRNGTEENRNALVSSWLGKMNAANQPVYIVAPPGGTLDKQSKRSSGVPTPVYAIPPHSGFMRYPLIPAPLGYIPPPPPNFKKMRRPCPSKARLPPSKVHATKMRKREEKKEVFSEKDAARTYTGLDKTIAEEFIDICESRHVSSSSEGSCCGHNSSNGGVNSSDAASGEFLVKNE